MKDHPGYTVGIMQKIIRITYNRKLHNNKEQIFYCIEIYQKNGIKKRKHEHYDPHDKGDIKQTVRMNTEKKTSHGCKNHIIDLPVSCFKKLPYVYHPHGDQSAHGRKKHPFFPSAS